jgi:hypothetical protein
MARSRFLNQANRLCGLGLLLAQAGLGCQSDYAGQTLPSPYWQKDDVQYFPPGPEFKLSREAAALKSYGTGRGARPATAPLGPPAGAPAPEAGGLDGAAGAPRPGALTPDGGAPPMAPPAEVREEGPQAPDPFAP